MIPDELEKDYESYKQLVDLWAKENPIKTQKLQMLLLFNGLLLAAVSISGGFVPKNWPLYWGGFLACLVWTLSIGRTTLFQKIWQKKITDLAAKYPGDPRFQILADQNEIANIPKFLLLLGGVPSKYYLIGTPIVFGLGWLIALVYF